MDNLTLWDSVSKTDPAYTKAFSKAGGFKGTAISPMYLIHKATEKWGPMGSKWGLRLLQERTQEAAPILDKDGACIGHELLHIVVAELFYPGGSVASFGQTMLVGKNSKGVFTDEEAPKKSLTDALTKALSWLGFSADVHMGRFDDSKYVETRRQEVKEEQRSNVGNEEEDKLYDAGMAILQPAAEKGTKALEQAWKNLSPDKDERILLQKACAADLPALKETARKVEVASASPAA